jgi:hypothetical protein
MSLIGAIPFLISTMVASISVFYTVEKIHASAPDFNILSRYKFRHITCDSFVQPRLIDRNSTMRIHLFRRRAVAAGGALSQARVTA